MAIEITILKVSHSGEANAKKLLKYIQTCDVYGYETACSTEKIATDSENDWEDLLLKNPTRSAFLRLIESSASKNAATPSLFDTEESKHMRENWVIIYIAVKGLYGFWKDFPHLTL